MTELEIAIENGEDGARLELRGQLTAGDGQQRLRETVGELLEGGTGKIVLDLAEVTYMDSAGLGEMVAAYTRTRDAGGSLSLCRASATVSQLLRLSGLDRFFPVAC